MFKINVEYNLIYFYTYIIIFIFVLWIFIPIISPLKRIIRYQVSKILSRYYKITCL